MLRSARVNKLTVLVIALVAILAVAGQTAETQAKPFKISGGGLAPDGISLIPGTAAFHWAVGTATELGEYYGEGHFQILDFTGPLTAEFSSAPDFVFTAANGDELAFTYGVANQPGVVTLTPNSDGSLTAVFVAEFNPVPENCTGRFAKVTGGSFVMVAKSEPFFVLGTTTTPFAYTWEGEGQLAFSKGK
jgi:hypothetical protein